jgi:hypothetical protein
MKNLASQLMNYITDALERDARRPRYYMDGCSFMTWEQNDVLHTSKWLGGMTLPVLPIALSTIGLSLLLLAVDRYDPRRHWRD